MKTHTMQRRCDAEEQQSWLTVVDKTDLGNKWAFETALLLRQQDSVGDDTLRLSTEQERRSSFLYLMC